MKIKLKDSKTLLEGHFVGEDDSYVYLRTQIYGRVRVPQENISFLVDEEASASALPAPPVASQVPPNELPSPVAAATKEQPPLVGSLAEELAARKEAKLKKAMGKLSEQMRGSGKDYIMKADPTALSELSQIDPPAEPNTYDPDNTKTVDVLFEGDKEGGFRLDIPVELMGGRYTPALGRSIFANVEVTNFIEGVMLQGVPKVTNDTVTYKTVNREAPESNLNFQDKLKMAGAAISAGTSFSKEKASPRPTSFSMTASPFDSLPKLTLNEDVDEGS